LKDAGVITGDVTEAVNDMTGAIASGRTMALKRMGIIIDTQVIEEEYAKTIGKTVAQLTEQEKRVALTNEVLRQSEEQIKKLPQPTVDAADQMDQLSVSMTELKIAIGEAAAPAISQLVGHIQSLVEWFNNLSPSTKEMIGNLLVVGTIMALVLGPIITLVAILPAVWSGLLLVSAGLTAVTFAGLPLWFILSAILLLIIGLVAQWQFWNDKTTTTSQKWQILIAQFIQAHPLLKLILDLSRSLTEAFKENGSMLETLKGAFSSFMGIIDQVIQKVQSLIATVERLFSMGIERVAALLSGGDGGGGKKKKKVNDFILQPGGRLIETNPDDTLLGIKNFGKGGMGTGGSIINITIGTVQGVNPDDIAEALKLRLTDLVSI